ncbi:hypothetical protein DERF_013404 [Dermatophagoides farinae]|uniref:Protein krueppel n=1 Tax=Dermatophagoides farinae TaxID=6954 RepID=A0A922HM50_DERFA|nr:hypothetical protein DERF_013404 [Dermatophagoides farinae]
MIVPATSSSLDRENLGEYQQQYNRSAKLSNMNGNNYHHQTSESNDHHNDHYPMIHIEMDELEKLFDNVESKFDSISEHIESLIMNSIRQQQQPFDCQQVEQTPARSNVLSFDHDYFHIDNGDDNTLEFVDQSTISSSKETRDLCINPKDSVITISYDNPNDEIDDDDMNIIQSHSEQQNSSSSNENLITKNLTKNKKFPCPNRSNVLFFDHDYFHIDNGDDNTLEFLDQSTTSSSKETRDLCTNPQDSLITINYDNPNDEIDDDDMNIIQNLSEQQNSLSSNENLIIKNLTRNKQFPCPKCSFGFDTSRNLDNHLKTHQPGNKYLCSFCGNRFKVKSRLIIHRRIHTNERPFKCQECDATFTDNSNLICHRRIHTGERPYKCSHCNATFTQNSNLIRHCLIHTGERPYKCSHCNATFTQSSNLTSHRRIHTGERPYQCSHCNDKFRVKHILNIHIKSKHSDVE